MFLQHPRISVIHWKPLLPPIPLSPVLWLFQNQRGKLYRSLILKKALEFLWEEMVPTNLRIVSRAKSTQCVFLLAPMKESTTEQHEGETGTGGGEATSIQASEATGMYTTIKKISNIPSNLPYHFCTGSLSTGASTAGTRSLASAGETSVSQQLWDYFMIHYCATGVTVGKLKPDDGPDFPRESM